MRPNTPSIRWRVVHGALATAQIAVAVLFVAGLLGATLTRGEPVTPEFARLIDPMSSVALGVLLMALMLLDREIRTRRSGLEPQPEGDAPPVIVRLDEAPNGEPPAIDLPETEVVATATPRRRVETSAGRPESQPSAADEEPDQPWWFLAVDMYDERLTRSARERDEDLTKVS